MKLSFKKKLLLKWALMYGTDPVYVDRGAPYWDFRKAHMDIIEHIGWMINTYKLPAENELATTKHYVVYYFEDGRNVFRLSNAAIKALKGIGDE